MFFTTRNKIQEAKDEIFKYKLRVEAANNIGGKVYLSNEEIKKIIKYNSIVGGAVHPDTNEIIPFYMRLSGFVPFNFPIVFAVLFIRNQTPIFNAGMQVLNQTYNAGINYGNRNASSTYTTKDLGRGYLGAVSVSVAIALFTRTIFSK